MNAKNRLIEKLLKVAKKHKILTYPVLALVAVISVFNYFFSWSTGAGKRIVAVVMVLVMLVSQSYFLTSSATALVDTEETVKEQQELQEQQAESLVDDSDIKSEESSEDDLVDAEGNEGVSEPATENLSDTTEQVTSENSTEVAEDSVVEDSIENEEPVFTEDEHIENTETNVGTDEPVKQEQEDIEAQQATVVKAQYYHPDNSGAIIGDKFELTKVEGGYEIPQQFYDNAELALAGLEAGDYYTCEGWYTDISCADAYHFTGQVIPESLVTSNDIRLFAKMSVKNFKVAINTDGGKYDGVSVPEDGNASTQLTKYYLVPANESGVGTFTITNPTKIGYDIAGAGGHADASTILGDDLEITVSGKSAERTIELLWTADSYSVHYAASVNAEVVGQFTQSDIEYNGTAVLPEANDAIKSAKPGYKFVSWGIGPDGRKYFTGLMPGQMIKNVGAGNGLDGKTLQEYLYEDSLDGHPATMLAEYAYDGVELSTESISYQYRSANTLAQQVIGRYASTQQTGNFSYEITSVTAGGENVELSDGSYSKYGVNISVNDRNGVFVETDETGPTKVTTFDVAIQITDNDANENDKISNETLKVSVSPCAIVLQPEVVPSKTFDGTATCTTDFSDGIPTNVEGVKVKVTAAEYEDVNAGNPDVLLTIPSTGWLESTYDGDAESNYTFNTSAASIPGEITKRVVYIKTYADMGGREYIRAGEASPNFYAEEVTDSNSQNTGLIASDKGKLSDPEFITLTTHKARNDDVLHTILEETYMIVAAKNDQSNYNFSTMEQGSFVVKLESPNTRYIMPESDTGYFGPNNCTIKLSSSAQYTSFRLPDGTVFDSVLEMTEENTEGDTIKFQLYDKNTGAFTSFVTENVQVDTSKPEYKSYIVSVDDSGSGQGLYFPSAGGNLSFGHYYNKTLTFTIYYYDKKSRPVDLKYRLSGSLGGGNGEDELSVKFGSPDGDNIAAAKFEIPVGFVDGEAVDKIGTITFKAVDAAGNESDYYHLEKEGDEWAVEQVGPEVVSWGVKAGLNNEITVDSTKDIYYSNCKAYLTVRDTASGLYGVTWYVNDGTYQQRVSVTDSKVNEQTFTFDVNEASHPSDNGTYTIYPVITDNAGNNISLIDRALTFKVDDEEPEVEILNQDSYNSYQQVVTIAFEAYDKLSGIQYLKIEDENGELNNTDYNVVFDRKTDDGKDIYKCYMTTPRKGTYYIKAVDVAGNVYENRIVLDKVSNETPECPTVIFDPEVNENGWITSDEAKAIINNISFTNDMTPVDTQYQLWKDGESSLHITTIESDEETEELVLSDGVYKLRLWSESATGILCESTEEEGHIYTVQVDSTEPTITYELKKGSDNSLVVDFKVTDETSGVNGETIKVFNGVYPVAVKVEALEDGTGFSGSFAIKEVGSYSIVAEDIAGNSTQAPAFKPMSMKVSAVKNIAAGSATVGARVIKGSYPIQSANISYRKFTDSQYIEADSLPVVDDITGDQSISAVLDNLEQGTNYVYKVTAMSEAGEVLEYVGYFKTLSDRDAGITVSGTVRYRDGRDGYITVGLFSGNSCIRAVEVDTSLGNTFAFNDVADGNYTVLATDGVYSKNARVLIQNGRIIFPDSASIDLELSGMNTSVEITTDETPDVTADNLDSLFNDETNYTEEDRLLVEDGNGTVEFKLYATLMQVSSVSPEEISVMYSAASDKNKIVGAYLDLTLYKIVTDENGNVNRSQVHKLGGGANVSVTIPLGDLANKSGLEVIRIHKNDDHFTGAYLVDQDNNPNTYTITSSQFSTYAVLYDPDPEPETPPTTEEIKDGTISPSQDGAINNPTDDTEVEPDEDKKDDEDKKKDDDSEGSSVGSLTSSGSAKTGDASPVAVLFGMMVISVLGILFLRKKAKNE